MRIYSSTVFSTTLLLATIATLQDPHLTFAQNQSRGPSQSAISNAQTTPRNSTAATANPLANPQYAQSGVQAALQPAVTTGSAQASPGKSSIRWRPNLAEARAEARQSGKPILLHFYTNNCVNCEKLENGTFRDPLVTAEVEAEFVPVKVFAPDNATATQALRVDRFPTDVVVNADGVVLTRTLSPLDPAAYISMLNSVIEDHRRLAVGSQPTNSWSNRSAEIDAQNYGHQLAGPENRDAMSNASQQDYAAQNSRDFGFQSTPPQNGLVGANARLTSGPQEFAGPREVPAPQGFADRSVPVSQPVAPQRSAGGGEAVEPIMEGYCLVTLVDDFQWQMGKSNIGAVHLGQLYLFSSNEAREKFLKNPQPYAPVMNGLDVVKFFDEGQIVEGVRAKGCTTEYPARLFFFSSEQTLAKFESSEQSRAYYTQRAIELTERAAAEANALSGR